MKKILLFFGTALILGACNCKSEPCANSNDSVFTDTTAVDSLVVDSVSK